MTAATIEKSTTQRVRKAPAKAADAVKAKASSRASAAKKVSPVATAKAVPQMATGASVGIPPRHMDFAFDEKLPRYVYGNDPFLTTFWLAMSGVFPEGEMIFVDSVRQFRDQITDPKLKAQIAGFIGQEAMHSKEHKAFNDWATAQGFPVDYADRHVGKILGLFKKYTPAKFRLAGTVCLEHYTAILAEQLLREPAHSEMIAEGARPLWMWHALEENEHKTVAYDVYEKTVNSYAWRAGTMVPVTIILFALVHYYQARMLYADGQLFNFKNNWKGVKYFWGRKGLFTRLAPKFFDFFRPDFHPLDHDTVDLLKEWEDKLFGEKGVYRHMHKNPLPKAA